MNIDQRLEELLKWEKWRILRMYNMAPEVPLPSSYPPPPDRPVVPEKNNGEPKAPSSYGRYYGSLRDNRSVGSGPFKPPASERGGEIPHTPYELKMVDDAPKPCTIARWGIINVDGRLVSWAA